VVSAPPEETAIRVGARFGDVTLLREIGRGGQGVVYEARQESVGRRVAVKILPRDLTYRPDQVERFRREAEAAGRLSHPNIVAVYELLEASGHHLIVQELVAGGSLADRVTDRKKASQHTDVNHCAWAATIGRQLADALQHAHDNQVVHRDMKPANVLLTESGTPKITDFGLAKLQDAHGLSLTGAIFGTPSFMSPEQVMGKGGVDHRSDIYSLGAVLYQLLTNELPFQAETMQGLFVDILTRAPKAPRRLQPGVSADLEAVCLKAMEKSPDARYATAAELGADLGRYLAGEPTAARPVGPLGQALRWLRRLASSTLAVVALLVPLAWLLIDSLWLRAEARSRPAWHDARLGVAALAAMLLAWPLALLGVRLARGRAWGRALALGVVALLGGWQIASIGEQRTRQMHLTDRAALWRVLDQEVIGRTRADVSDLEDYATRWEGRLDGYDRLLLARGFLKRSRPTRASDWIRHPEAAAIDSPQYYALLWAVHDALGEDAQAEAAKALARQRSQASTDWAALAAAAGVLRDMKDFAGARDLLQLAGLQPRADRDRLNLQLAWVSQDLCHWDEAGECLRDYAKWHPDDAEADRATFVLAMQAQDWATAENALARIEARTDLFIGVRLDARHRWLLARASLEEASAQLQSTYEASGDDPAARDCCASMAIDVGRAYEGKALESRNAGDEAGVASASDSARQWFQRAVDWFAALANEPRLAVAAHASRAAALIRLAPRVPERSQELLTQAIEEARLAISLDADYWEAHFNLGLALRRAALGRCGNKEDALPLDELLAYVEAMRRALQCNGLNGLALNDTAHGLGLVYARNHDRAWLEEAFSDVRLAIRRLEPRPENACRPSDTDRAWLSSAHDTLRELHELNDDPRSALLAARAALADLIETDARYAARRDAVERLVEVVGE
jgi:hypothetical protein